MQRNVPLAARILKLGIRIGVAVANLFDADEPATGVAIIFIWIGNLPDIVRP